MDRSALVNFILAQPADTEPKNWLKTNEISNARDFGTYVGIFRNAAEHTDQLERQITFRLRMLWALRQRPETFVDALKEMATISDLLDRLPESPRKNALTADFAGNGAIVERAYGRYAMAARLQMTAEKAWHQAQELAPDDLAIRTSCFIAKFCAKVEILAVAVTVNETGHLVLSTLLKAAKETETNLADTPAGQAWLICNIPWHRLEGHLLTNDEYDELDNDLERLMAIGEPSHPFHKGYGVFAKVAKAFALVKENQTDPGLALARQVIAEDEYGDTTCAAYLIIAASHYNNDNANEMVETLNQMVRHPSRGGNKFRAAALQLLATMDK